VTCGSGGPPTRSHAGLAVTQAHEGSSRRRTEIGRRRPAATAQPYAAPWQWLRQAAKTATIVALLGGGWLAYQAVEFHAPASVVKALLPRH